MDGEGASPNGDDDENEANCASRLLLPQCCPAHGREMDIPYTSAPRFQGHTSAGCFSLWHLHAHRRQTRKDSAELAKSPGTNAELCDLGKDSRGYLTSQLVALLTAMVHPLALGRHALACS
eukprot:1168736-Pyramimonas_sp.AAC.1